MEGDDGGGADDDDDDSSSIDSRSSNGNRNYESLRHQTFKIRLISFFSHFPEVIKREG